MALRVCEDCTTKFAVGLEECPHCGSTDHREDDGMPKVTVHEGASVFVDADNSEPDNLPGDVTVHRAEDSEGGEQSSPGSSSETSAEKQPTSDEQSSSGSQSPARTTASRSKKGQTGSSSAASTGGGQTGRTSANADDGGR
ncbi:hypothetical protein [Streptomyces cucumeris]|uniref:hypothetical protein n=1 Tax=Streptomyces cucumeris TaxID=2962890 RepID=UPI003D75074A